MVFHLHKANRPPPHRPAALAASPGLHCSRQRRHSLSTSLASCLVAPDWNSYLEEFNGRLVDKWFLVVKGKSLGNTYLNIWRPGGGWATVGVVRHKARSLCNHFTKFYFDFLLWVFSVYFTLILFKTHSDRQPSRARSIFTGLKVLQQFTHRLFSFAAIIEPQVLSQRCIMCHFTVAHSPIGIRIFRFVLKYFVAVTISPRSTSRSLSIRTTQSPYSLMNRCHFIHWRVLEKRWKKEKRYHPLRVGSPPKRHPFLFSITAIL